MDQKRFSASLKSITNSKPRAHGEVLEYQQSELGIFKFRFV